MRQFAKCSVIIILTLGFAPMSYAYLDPGSGSVLLQGLLAGFAGVLAIIKMYWQRIKEFFVKRFAKKGKPLEDVEQPKRNDHD